MLVAASVLTGLVAATGTASAHGAVGGGIEAPIPLWLLYTGAGATVALTAGWLAVGERQSDTGRGPGESHADREATNRQLSVGLGTSRLLRTLGQSLGLVALALVLLDGLAGPQVQSDNVATVLFWPVWLKGLGLVAMLVGSPWRVVSPWATLYRGLVRLEGEPIALLGEYPSRLAHWPALLGFVGLVGITENITTLPRSPRLTAAVVAGYALVMLVGALAVGPEWFRRADPLSVLYRLFGRVAPVAVERTNGGYRLSLRPPWRACTRPVADRSLVVFAIATVYTVSFDGLTNTRPFQTLLSGFALLGTPTGTAIALYGAGFALFVVSYWGAIKLVTTLGTGAGRGGMARAFAGSLLPIAAAYEVAHTYPFVLRNLGGLIEIGTAGFLSPDLVAWLPVAGFWGSQILLIVGGHVAAVVAAHAVATTHYGRRGGRRAHLPLVVVMVGYTVLSLWIISQPVVA
ncbi:hypothetical protein Harman_09490 [Haloarcula mannanilytica]|uniref:Uncharacterized protein n=1 Tax=Haloarcula mannanilytica TaxID=2509225 RepID=A0A4C2EF59_9EURY|nr:hypothetical protein Harman_09490 [Haloarcula mannanilytica]